MIDRHYSSYCFLASELSIEKKIKYSRQAANSQSMGFAINISHAQGVENRNILLWFKCVLTALHVNCIVLFDKVL
jgi:hypothetical protein